MTTPEELARASRAAQGLPPTVEDPATLDRVARLVASATARRSPATRLAVPSLEPLVDELVRRFSSGRDPVRVTLPDLSATGRARLADLLGLDRHLAAGSSLAVDRLAAALDVHDAAGLRAVLVQLRGPLGDRRAERVARATARSALWADLAAEAAMLRVFGDPVVAGTWVDQVAAAGVPGGDVDAHRRVLDLAVACLRRLPADPPVSLAGLAADVTGTAHGLDPGRRVARLVLDALALAFGVVGVEATVGAESARSLWEQAGVVPDPLSSTVLALGLRPRGGDPLAVYLRAAADAGEPVVLTLRQLQRWPVDALVDAPVAYLFENPSLVAEVVGTWPRAPVLCSSGRPSLAVVLLVRRLVAGGTEVRQHADFDPSGIAITRWLGDRAGTVPWRMGSADYRAAVEAGGPTAELVGVVGDTPWDPDLVRAMNAAGRAVHEEALRAELLTEIRSGAGV